jgi:glucose/arabinose dehydrogenase
MNREPRRLTRRLSPLVLLVAFLTACQSEEAPTTQATQAGCDPDNGGLSLPPGFCAVVFANSIGRGRHIEVASDGTVFLALTNARGPGGTVIPGGFVVLRDLDGDGKADETTIFGENGGNEVLLDDGFLYFATDDAVLRYPFEGGWTAPSGPPDTIVGDLPDESSHRAKSLAFGPNRSLYVNIGSPSNACQADSRTPGVPGLDPCPELETRAGIWRFAADLSGQRQSDGTRFATGLRNVVALRSHPSGTLFGVVHGRDQLSSLWGDLFSDEDNAEKPSEEFVRIEEGDDFGWPYCYHDPATNVKVMAPEYGGDGTEVGRCAGMKDPFIGFPAHWAPNDLEFYMGTQFPEEYRGGAFIAFHGSWNRAPLPQAGYNVVFAPFDGGEPTGSWEVFADGFAQRETSPRGALHRPVGLAVGPDGSLFISDSQRGAIWKVMYVG